MNEEEKNILGNIKNILSDLEDTEDGAIISLNQEEIDSLKSIPKLIEKQQKEIEELEKDRKLLIQAHKMEKHNLIVLDGREYISKDKIRAIIEDLEKHRIMSSDDFTIKVLKGLLKE